jgi:hypothetical protein
MRHHVKKIISLAFIALSINCASAENEKQVEKQNLFSRLWQGVESVLKKIESALPFGHKADADKAEGAELLEKNVKVPESMHLEYAGPRGMKAKAPEINMKEVVDAVAPMPVPEPMSVDDRNNAPMRKEMIKNAELDAIKSESHLVEELAQKTQDIAPRVPVSNTLSVEKEMEAPRSIDDLVEKIEHKGIEKGKAEVAKAQGQ